MNQPAPLSIDTIVIDPVRCSSLDLLDPTDEIDSNSFAQKFNRSPLPGPRTGISIYLFSRRDNRCANYSRIQSHRPRQWHDVSE